MLGKPVLLTVLLLLSGCFQGDKGSPEPNPPEDDPPTGNGHNGTNGNGSNGNETDGNVTPSPIARAFTLNDCEHQASGFDWPGPNTGPGEVPPGWEAESTIGSVVQIIFMQCTRMSWGPLERPVLLAIEAHSKGITREECADQTPNGLLSAATIHRVWTNDTEIASYLTDTYGIPTGMATITREDTELQTAGKRRWSLQPSGSEASYVEFTKGDDDADTTTFWQRWIWWNGTVLGFLDMHQSYTSAVDTQVAAGEMFPPTLNAEAGVRPWAGVSDWNYDMDVRGEVYMWLGTDCTTPL